MHLQKSISPLMGLDHHGDSTGYQVRSLYFDSLNDNDLQDNLNGIWHKGKVRMRIYSASANEAYLEWKQKYGSDGFKSRIRLHRTEAISVMNGDFSSLVSKDVSMDATKLYFQMISGAYSPKTIVQYNRLAYLYPASDTRICFDTNICSSGHSISIFDTYIPLIPILPPDIGVLEVKYNHFLASPLRQLIGNIDRLSQANSKYVHARMIL